MKEDSSKTMDPADGSSLGLEEDNVNKRSVSERSTKCYQKQNAHEAEEIKMDVTVGQEVPTIETFTHGLDSRNPADKGSSTFEVQQVTVTGEIPKEASPNEVESPAAPVRTNAPRAETRDESESIESGEKTNKETSDRQQEKKLQIPRVNCPEKIIICIDLSEEMAGYPFRVSDGTRYAAVSMVKRIVDLFVNNKHEIDKRHEFALVVLHETAAWTKNFSREPKDIFNILDELETETCENCNLFSLFDLVAEKIQLPNVTGNAELVPPPYVVRTVVIYGRSLVVPQIEDGGGNESLQKLQQSPYFFLDVLYMHDTPLPENKCEEIYNKLCDLDKYGTSYILEVGRNPTKLHNCMAKLLAHPLQRPLQNDLFHKIDPSED